VLGIFKIHVNNIVWILLLTSVIVISCAFPEQEPLNNITNGAGVNDTALNQSLLVLTNKDVYELGEQVKISIINMLNETLTFGFNGGCEGYYFMVSVYENENWTYFPMGSGPCPALITQKISALHKKDLSWDQQVYVNAQSMEKRLIVTGKYRITLAVMIDDQPKYFHSKSFHIIS